MAARAELGDAALDAAGFRSGLLRAAGYLHLEEARVAELAEGLTGRRWEDCDVEDLMQVLQALRQVFERVTNAQRGRA